MAYKQAVLPPSRTATGRRNPARPLFSSPFSEGASTSRLFPTAMDRRLLVRSFEDQHASDDDGDEPDLQDEASPLLHRKSHEDEEADEDDEEDEDNEITPLLPIFSEAHLDAIPTYNLTHVVRLLISSRCETTLSWDQLRSPQVSQFLVKPIQQQIRTKHFSRATLYILMANCLQFSKEGQLNPGNSGVSNTRALVCELLAIKLLKEFDNRALIDALSYDFLPSQGLPIEGAGLVTPHSNWDAAKPRIHSGAARISTLEIAIRALAKRFLAHPLVVQHLESIWAGNIIFHSAADNLHRQGSTKVPSLAVGYGSGGTSGLNWETTPDKLHPSTHKRQLVSTVLSRRSVTLYDPREASVFKLSRLRVPRYRQTLSTCSLAVLLALYLAVLFDRSLPITTLEVVFWFWSAGFMLDELVGFNEQGFSLYIMSFWNTFDLGILLLLVVYYMMRLYGLLMPESDKIRIADMAYDVLAANAVLLFPRLFSVLDHYRYFSQLLIAFRLMAVDLMAMFILIMISCSGFFVAFTLSFGKGGYDARGVAYSLFQILLGFTPAAWNAWDDYNTLGKTIMILFLITSHFLVVTILITVLTNSFMAIVGNANEEHQFVFAVNTISMVKSDALFSYIAPTNIIAWLLAPLRYLVTFRRFVKINRTVIKVTHFPILLTIYLYERVILRKAAFDPMDLVDHQRRGRDRFRSDPPRPGINLFSPGGRLRQESVAGYQKDQALEEVFRSPFKDTLPLSTQKSQERRQTSNVVNSWMQGVGNDGGASTPSEQDRSTVDRLERRRPALRRWHGNRSRKRSGTRDFTDATRSVASDPEDFMSTGAYGRPLRRREQDELPNMSMEEVEEPAEEDGDDEMHSNDDDENVEISDQPTPEDSRAVDYFQTPIHPSRNRSLLSTSLLAASRSGQGTPSAPQTDLTEPRRGTHTRNASSATILHRPGSIGDEPSNIAQRYTQSPAKTPMRSEVVTKSPRKRSPQRLAALDFDTGLARAIPRPIVASQINNQSTPDLTGLVRRKRRKGSPSLRASSLGLDAASELGNDFAGGHHLIGAVPSSFATQMALATGAVGRARKTRDDAEEDSRMMSRLMLARMKTLEEGFGEMLKEVKRVKADERPSAAGRGQKSGWRGDTRGTRKDRRGRGEAKSLPISEELATSTPGEKSGESLPEAGQGPSGT